LTEKQQKKAIFVSNISPKATIKHISEFFSYCGSVEKVVQDFDPNSSHEFPTQFAVVIFDNDQSFATALLLGSSQIEDSKINIHPYSSIVLSTLSSTMQGDEEINSSGQRSSSSVVTTLIALGYISGENLMNEVKTKAQEMDESMNLSEKVSSAFKYSLEQSKNFDETYKVTETISGIGQQAYNTSASVYKNIDETLGLNEKAKSVKEFSTSTASNISNTAMAYEPVKTSVDFISNVTSNSWNFLKDGWSFWTTETSNEIQRQQPKQTPTQSKPIQTPVQTQTQSQPQIEVKKEEKLDVEKMNEEDEEKVDLIQKEE
jgi:hypothetical protein